MRMQSDHRYLLCGGGVYAEAVVNAFTYQPHDVIAAAQHPLVLFAGQGKLAVGQVVAHLFLARHAERYESIPLLP